MWTDRLDADRIRVIIITHIPSGTAEVLRYTDRELDCLFSPDDRSALATGRAITWRRVGFEPVIAVDAIATTVAHHAAIFRNVEHMHIHRLGKPLV